MMSLMSDRQKYLYLEYSRFDTVVLLDELCTLYYRWLSNRDYQDLGDRISCIRRIIVQRTKFSFSPVIGEDK